MGAPKQKWTAEEEEALRAGVDKHGAGKWRTIQKDPEFSRCLATRSNIDLKDKWRNMSISASGQGSREKIRTPKAKVLPVIPPSGSQSLIVSAPHKDGVSATADPTKSSQEAKLPPRYTVMIIEALAAMKEPNGSEIGAICSFIEQRHEVPQNFRRLLSSKLRRLVAQNKIERAHRVKLSPLLELHVRDLAVSSRHASRWLVKPCCKPGNCGSCCNMNNLT
ncbi:single myb histone 4 isoform X2 [Musa acuminata AAA Group]|uniref:single myb histone 4 isoform X2 n=1 Tax=Musa acuminata AAA Group TaxID=214697 RepID=UPI0031DE8A4B